MDNSKSRNSSTGVPELSIGFASTRRLKEEFNLLQEINRFVKLNDLYINLLKYDPLVTTKSGIL